MNEAGRGRASVLSRPREYRTAAFRRPRVWPVGLTWIGFGQWVLIESCFKQIADRGAARLKAHAETVIVQTLEQLRIHHQRDQGLCAGHRIKSNRHRLYLPE